MTRKRIVSIILCIFLALAVLSPAAIRAEETAQTPMSVKAGYFACDGYHEMDETGKRSGYGYDFLQLTRKYANLNYEYVGYEKSWDEMQVMLLNGEIDMVTSAHRTERNQSIYDFSMPIGTDMVVISTRLMEDRFIAGDFSTYDGMVLGMLSADANNNKIWEFSQESGFTYTARYYPDTGSLEQALASGEVDAVASSSLRRAGNEKILSEFAAEPFYCMVRKGDTELLSRLNYAIEQMNAVEENWKNRLYNDNYIVPSQNLLAFTEQEQEFIRRYSTGGETLVIGIDTNWTPFSWVEDGEHRGFLPAYVDRCMKTAGISYSYFDDGREVCDASILNEADVALYVGLSQMEGEADPEGLIVSDTILDSKTAFLTRRGGGEIRTVALCRTTPYLNQYLEREEGVVYEEFKDTSAAKQAVLRGSVDAAFLYSLDAEYSCNQDPTGMLVYEQRADTTVAIKAVIRENDDHTLMSIFVKCADLITESEKSELIAAYLSYSAADIRIWDYLFLNPGLTIVVVIVLLSMIFTIGGIQLRRRGEQRHRRVLEEKMEEIVQLNEKLQREQKELLLQYNFSEALTRDVGDMFILDVNARTSTSIKIGGMLLPMEKRVSRPYEDTWRYYIEKYVLPEDRAKMYRLTDQNHVVRMLQSQNEYTGRYRIIGDSTVNYQVTFTPLGPEEPGIIVFGFRCIDGIVRAEMRQNQVLSSLNRRLKENMDIITNAGYGIWNICRKPDGHHTMTANGTLRRIFGVEEMKMTPEELYVFYHGRLLDDVNEIEQGDYAAMQNGELKSRILKWNHPEKGIIYLMAGGTSHVQSDGESIISGYCGDVTEQRLEILRLNEQLAEAVKQTNAANKAKSDFLFSMSHDIRTPMNAIIGFAGLLEKNYHDEEKCRDYLEKIQSSSEFLLSLINNVLEMARIESGNVQLDEGVWGIREFNDVLFSVFEEQMAQKKIRYTRKIDIEHGYIFCDSVKMREIFLNILSNALKYTPEGGSVHMQVEELPAEREDVVRIRTIITDTGIGMSKEYLPHIFDEFSRERTVTENKIQGTGLGMPIVKKLVDLMGGTIDVESEPGQGTSFTVIIDHRKADAGNAADQEMIETINTDFAGRRILLAEDNELNAEIAMELLEETGAQVDRAADGIICVNMLEQAAPGTYDLILMDIQMPNMNGYKATEIIRQLEDERLSQIPIIAMTANAFEEDRRNAFAAGMNDHLAKPIQISILLETLSRYLR